MKKFLLVIFSVALAVFALAACNLNNSTDLGIFEGSSSSQESGSSQSSSSEDEESSSTKTEEDDQDEGWTDWH